jgi:hypothetical protein
MRANPAIPATTLPAMIGVLFWGLASTESCVDVAVEASCATEVVEASEVCETSDEVLERLIVDDVMDVVEEAELCDVDVGFGLVSKTLPFKTHFPSPFVQQRLFSSPQQTLPSAHSVSMTSVSLSILYA